VRHLLVTLVVASVAPMLLLALGLIFYQGAAEGGSRQVAILVTGTLLVASITIWLAFRWAGAISRSIERLSAAVLATGIADSLELPPPRFVEEHGLGQAFLYATTSLRDAHEALRAKEARLRTVLNTARDAIITADDEGRIVLFNHAAEEMFGVDEADALGLDLDAFIPPESGGKRHMEYMRMMKPDVPAPRSMGQARVVRALRADGTRFPVNAAISCGSDGDKRLYTAILRGVAEGKLDLDVTAALHA
jgi:PAS domain S-box-containing protein